MPVKPASIILVVVASLGSAGFVGCCRRPCCPAVAHAPVPDASVAPVRAAPKWTAEQRSEALEAVREVARARIASARGFADETGVAYAAALGLLAEAPAGTPGADLRARVEGERQTPPRPAARQRPEGFEAPRLTVHEVGDLVARMDAMRFPRVQLVGPDGVRDELRSSSLGGGLYDLLPHADQPVGPKHAAELEAPREGVFVLRAPPERHEAMRIYLAALRELWPLLAAPVAPPLVVEIHAVADLVVALERLGPEVDLTLAKSGAADVAQAAREGTAVERLRETLLLVLAEYWLREGRGDAAGFVVHAAGEQNFVVRGTRADQTTVHALLEGWRETWRARWPEAFDPM
jgi:hypothetical protein